MNIELNEMAFSMAGSYMVLSYLPENYRGCVNRPGLYLRSVHGTDANCANERSMIARIVPTFGGAEIESEVTATPNCLTMKTAKGEIKAAFDDENTLIFRGKGEGLGILVDYTPTDSMEYYNQMLQWQGGDRLWYVTYIYTNVRRYMSYCQTGSSAASQNWDGRFTGNAKYAVEGVKGEFLMVIEEVVDSWKDSGKTYSLEEAISKTRASFDRFLRSMPSVPDAYEEAAQKAAYINWSSLVRPEGLIKRPAMFMSKNWMTSIWAWDHCFNAFATAYGNPDMAWDQFMVLFDQQKPSGLLPDSINDVIMLADYCKPPVHGWAYHRLKQIFTISDEQKKEAYEKLTKWTNWWLNYRDINKDGLCEYAHGNDSGWDNSTVFMEGCPITSPDLAAFMILQMEELSSIATELGKEEESASWKQKADQMLDTMLDTLFVNGKPVARHSFSGEIAENRSLLPYISIILGDRLPKEIRSQLVSGLSQFETPYGYATENPASPKYIPDGYWQGPIWAPSTLIIVDGLEACGEHELAGKIARKFCEMVRDNGCAENFDALTGEGLRDRAYTWTSSVMFVLAHEYLL